MPCNTWYPQFMAYKVVDSVVGSEDKDWSI